MLTILPSLVAEKTLLKKRAFGLRVCQNTMETLVSLPFSEAYNFSPTTPIHGITVHVVWEDSIQFRDFKKVTVICESSNVFKASLVSYILAEDSIPRDPQKRLSGRS